MMRRLGIGAFALGLAVLVWVAWGYAGHSPLALAMIGLIGAVYAAGARELWLFHQVSGGLSKRRARLSRCPRDRFAPCSPLASWCFSPSSV